MDKIAEQSALLKMIKVAVEAADDGIAITDARHRIMFMNRSFLSMHGYNPDDVDSYLHSDWRLLYNDSGKKFINSTVIPTTLMKGVWSGTITVMKRDGTLFLGDASLTKLQDGLILGVMRDVSERSKAEQERKALQDQLFQTQKMEAVVRLTGAVALDFDELLSNMRIDLDKFKGMQDARHLNGISSSIRKAQDLVDQLLAFSHKKKVKLHAVDVGRIISDVTQNELPRLPADVTFCAQCVSEKFFAYTNEGLMQKIILNLCLNALEAVEKNSGVVSVVVKDMRDTVSDISDLLIVDIIPDKEKMALVRTKMGYERNLLISGYLQRGREYLHIIVSDTGKGIEADILPNIFDPFFSTKAASKGAGLGLSTVQGIVTSGGGAVVIETTHRQGTHAHVFLPRHIQKIQPMVA